MYAAPPVLETKVFSAMPEKFKKMGAHSEWVEKRGAGPVHSFIEGPSFDREGNLFITDIPYGRIFRISPDGEWDKVAEYDGWPNGLKIHKDGRIFITDYRRGLLVLDPESGTVTPLLDTV